MDPRRLETNRLVSEELTLKSISTPEKNLRALFLARIRSPLGFMKT